MLIRTSRLLLLALFCCAASSLLAQAQINVQIGDYLLQQPLAGIRIELSEPALGIRQTATSDAQGRASFRALPLGGQYRISVSESDAYWDNEVAGIGLRANAERDVQLWLQPKREMYLGEVAVTANTSARLNTSDAEVAFELQKKDLEQIPIEGRDLSRVLFRLPNVAQATGFYPEAPNVSINGANSLFTSYLIDGMDNNERFLGGQKFAMPLGFAQNVAVLANNYSAEYGLTANGVVNVTSRSGSQQFEGEAFLITRPGPAIDGSSPYAQRDLSGNAVKDGFQRYQAGIGFGGPLRKEQTFYYVNLEHSSDLKDNRLSSPALGVNSTVRGENHFSYLSGKIDHQWSARWRSSLRLNAGRVSIERQGGGLEGGVLFPSAANAQDRNSLLLALQNSYVGRRLSVQTNVQYARFRWNYARPANPDSPQATVLGPDGSTIAVLGHPGYVFDQVENTLQWQQHLSYYLDRHTLKLGGGLISAQHELFGGGNANGNYLVQLDAAQVASLRPFGSALTPFDLPAEAQVLAYNVELRPAAFGARQNIFSFFVEDQWAIGPRLSLTLGLRYDYDNLSKGGSRQGDANNLAPRSSLNWRLGQRSSLRAGYGMFFDKIPYAIYSDALQQNTTSADYRRQLAALVALGLLPADTDLAAITFEGNLTASDNQVAYLQGPSAESLQDQRETVFSNERRILNPNGYDNPYTHQFALGYQWQADAQTLFFADLIHNRSHKLLRLRNLNAAAAYPLSDPDNVAVRTPAEADATRPTPIFSDAQGSYALIEGQIVRGAARNVVMSETAGEARYWALSLNWQKTRAEGGRWGYLFNYTLSRLENNTEDINFRAMDANDFAAEWGPSINDRTHILNGIVYWQALPGLDVSLAALLQSGQPINRIPDATVYGSSDLNGDGASFGDAYVGNSDRHPGEGRNSDRLPWANTFDLGLQYSIALGGGRLSLRADVFNLFNAQNLSGYSNNATQSNQIQPGAAASGLLIRRNAGPPRQFQFGLFYRF